MTTTAIVLANRVKMLRTRLGIRQDDLARETGVTRQTIIAIEKGRLNPSITISLKIARALREPVDYVFYLETRPVPEAPQPAPPAKEGRKPAAKPAKAKRPGKPKPDKPNPPQSVFDFF